MIRIIKKLLILPCLIALLATGCTHTTNPSPSINTLPVLHPTKIISLDSTAVSVQIATTLSEQHQGLSRIPHILSDEGMLFPYSPADAPVFWMKDMLFPIDIIWIRHNAVIGIQENVTPPVGTQTDSALTRYPSPGTVDAVLEVQAGWALKHSVHTGSVVTGL